MWTPDWFRKFRAERCPFCGKEFTWQRGHIKLYGCADQTGLITPTQHTCLECGRDVARLNALMLIHKAKNITYKVKDSEKITVTCDLCGYRGSWMNECPKCHGSWMPAEVYKFLEEVIGKFREILK